MAPGDVSLEQQLTSITERWIAAAASTTPIDHPVAEAALRRAYGAVRLGAPETILWVPSPSAGIELLGQSSTTDGFPFSEKVREARQAELSRPLHDARRAAVAEYRRAGLREQSVDIALDLVSDRLEEFLVWGIVEPICENLLTAQNRWPAAREKEADSSPVDWAYTGYHTQYACAWSEALQTLGVDVPEGWEGLCTLGQLAHWFWAFDEVAVMCERPVTMLLDTEGLLREAREPVITYADGWGF